MPPLVSCICITQNRRFFLRQAVRYFDRARTAFLHGGPLAAPVPDVELVVLDGGDGASNERLRIDDGNDGEGTFLCEVDGVRYFHEPSPPHAKTGPLHNRACELARGDIIIQWDDDDWQAPDRIVKQVTALEDRKRHTVQVAGMPEEGAFAYTSRFWWYHLGQRQACPARSWVTGGGSAGATFAYHRKAWEACPFRDVDQGEDNFFWQDHAARGTPMIDMLDPSLVVYIRHNRNGSHAVSDAYTPDDTERARAVMGADVPFYDELSEILPLDEVNDPNARWRQQYDRSRMVPGTIPWLRRK